MITHYPSVAKARLPESYVTAKTALRACARSFSPALYVAATAALAQTLVVDEIADWPQEEALAAYMRIGDDDELMRLIRRVERRRCEWIGRAVLAANRKDGP
ncbi:MAG: hypothetical protein J0H17_13835 [Rhizobiales bacterium]|nr:hypothetical protein [Hyphomicrobiales bacterium]